jgi:formylglycine-generating enzyme required for sulfatase activity
MSTISMDPARRRPALGVAGASLTRLVATAIALALAVALAGLAISTASSQAAVLTLKTVKVAAPGNPSVAIVPFTDAIYQSCANAPQSSKGCLMVGGVTYPYGIGQLEVTVKQWVAFLNAADATGSNRHRLYSSGESSSAWPKYGQINFSSSAAKGAHYSVASPAWADKPYGFANFLRAARFDNSLYNGRLLSKRTSSKGAFRYVTYRVAISGQTEHGMYNLSGARLKGPTRSRKTGFVIPSQDEWIKAAYYDPNGGGTYSYWKYPTNAGTFGDGTATAPSTTTLNSGNGNVTNASTQPLATYHASGVTAPTWCSATVQPQSNCVNVNPLGLNPTAYAKAYQGSLGTVGQAETTSPWGTLDQGGNAVEWTDTIAASPTGKSDGRVWRRLHGGIANAGAYQLWLSAVGLQPQDNAFFTATYPWLGLRIGVLGDLKAAKG